MFGASKERVREGRVSPAYTSDCEGVLFLDELVGALLPFSGKVAVGEMVAVEVLMGTAVGAVKDDEGEARYACDVYFIGSEACRRANGVITGVFDVGKVFIPVVLVFVADHG